MRKLLTSEEAVLFVVQFMEMSEEGGYDTGRHKENAGDDEGHCVEPVPAELVERINQEPQSGGYCNLHHSNHEPDVYTGPDVLHLWPAPRVRPEQVWPLQPFQKKIAQQRLSPFLIRCTYSAPYSCAS